MARKTIAIIPARGGSKSIPRKNIIPFCGKPLLAWSILQAKGAAEISDVYVSTDDADIARVAAHFGGTVIIRPKEISGDTAASESALSHALEELKHRGEEPDYVVFLQATSPVRESRDIDDAVRCIREQSGDSLFSGSLFRDAGIWKVEGGSMESISYDYKNRGRRQERSGARFYIENGSLYVFLPRTLARYGNRLGGKIVISEMDLWKSFEIDDPEDLPFLEHLFQARGLHRK